MNQIKFDKGIKMKKSYNLHIYCGRCHEPISKCLAEDVPRLEDKTFNCPKCSDEIGKLTGKFYSEFVVTAVRENETNVADEGLEIWAMPPNEIPKREWFTLKEVATKTGEKEETVRTRFKRGKLFFAQVSGKVQFSGSTVLVHKDVIQQLYGIDIGDKFGMKIKDFGNTILIGENMVKFYNHKTDTLEGAPIIWENGKLVEIDENGVIILKNDGFKLHILDGSGNIKKTYE